VLGDLELYMEVRHAICGFMLEDANWQGFADFAALQFSGAIGSAAHRAAFYAYMEPHRYGSEHWDLAAAPGISPHVPGYRSARLA
jgi:hypothetical protein